MNSDFYAPQPSKRYSAIGETHLERAKCWNAGSHQSIDACELDARIQAYLEHYQRRVYIKWATLALFLIILVACLVSIILVLQIWYLGFVISFILLLFIIFARRAYWVNPLSIN